MFSLNVDANEFPTLVTDTYVFFIVTGHISASWAWRPIFNEGLHIKALLILEDNGRRNQFLATHATNMDFFGFGHLEPPTACFSTPRRYRLRYYSKPLGYSVGNHTTSREKKESPSTLGLDSTTGLARIIEAPCSPPEADYGECAR